MTQRQPFDAAGQSIDVQVTVEANRQFDMEECLPQFERIEEPEAALARRQFDRAVFGLRRGSGWGDNRVVRRKGQRTVIATSPIDDPGEFIDQLAEAWRAEEGIEIDDHAEGVTDPRQERQGGERVPAVVEEVLLFGCVLQTQSLAPEGRELDRDRVASRPRVVVGCVGWGCLGGTVWRQGRVVGGMFRRVPAVEDGQFAREEFGLAA